MTRFNLYLPAYLFLGFLFTSFEWYTPKVHQAEEPIYFKGKGTDPVWSLSLSLDEVVFHSQFQGFESIVAPHEEPVKVMDSNTKRYTIVNEDMKMEIDLTSHSCQNPNSKERFNYNVEIGIRRKQDSTMTYFSGCGTYVTDPRIDGIWNVSEIKGKTVVATDALDTLPFIVLHASGNAFSGHSGCNSIRGRIFSERSLLRFTDVVVTKRTCPSAAREKEFVSALEFSTLFQPEGNKLILSNYGGVTLVFTKSD